MAAVSQPHISESLWRILKAINENQPLPGETQPIESALLGADQHPLHTVFAQQFVAVNLSESLKFNHTLVQLDLWEQGLREEVVSGIEQNLSHQKLNRLILSGNNIGEQGALSLARGLESNNSLAFLHLVDPTLGANGLEALQGALEKNTTLRQLTLSHKSAFEKEPMERVSAAIFRIRQKVVENENSFEVRSLSQEEREYRAIVAAVYEKLDAQTKANVEFFVWQNYGEPQGDFRFGKNHLFSSWQTFLASVRTARVPMVEELSTWHSEIQVAFPSVDLIEFSRWVQTTFTETEFA